ncbi:hypothetical protein SODALDRAFT_329103 [Sodiomyces alkalinus F11]|uniref:DUF125-domain-containing protein n=1 Tax=Sodiomyces alkalinus (strain CBS 110278 / VKM F-3762 / F11) TaxID=1314773 RepID=A0A3N2PK38_SODAK|nr:hypothetical protein SODALDRAFT_329103 [Sodiomyces alkalinus F11]ROT34902.1 hypothetical protein SODALDRAFT_329103 [Sodiomyces alkalinus F11]
MSLVTFRNLLFGRPACHRTASTEPGALESQDASIPAHRPETQPLLGGGKPRPSFSSSCSNTTRVEGEQGGERRNDEKKKRRFRIDARIISDATIGLADGLTVPFALTAGLSALGETRIVVYGGLAELIAGAISMGLGGYLGAKSEAASYRETRAECAQLAQEDPTHAAATALRSLFAGPAASALPPHALDALANHLASAPTEARVDLLLRARHGADASPDTAGDSSSPSSSSRSPAVSAFTIATGYLLGGLIPLAPYFFVPSTPEGVAEALKDSIVVMAFALFLFGYVRTCAVAGWHGRKRVWHGLLGGAEMVVVGGMAAGAAMGFVKLFDRLAGN